MEREHRRHYRVAMRQLEETPAEGMYVTREDMPSLQQPLVLCCF